MANHFFATNRGTGRHSQTAAVASVTEGTSSASTQDIEVRIADAAGLTKKDVQVLLDKIGQHIRRVSTFPIL